MIKLVPIDAVKASEYNPRRNDQKRLALAELSLRKLGFLLPIYADEHGEILSGHQRQLVARRMGFPEIPVEYVSEKELGERKAVNVLFNRATNDLQKQDTCAIVKKRLYEMDIQAMTEALPDIEPGSPESYPCVYALRRMDTVKLAKANHRNFDAHTKQLAKSLERKIRAFMPIVIGEEGNVINGIGRLQTAAEASRKVVPCVQIKKEQEAFASAMLNLLSMDFDMESNYADDLRFNSFMRERNTRETDAAGNAALGDGFFKGVFPKNNGRDFCILEGAALETWKRHYGSSVVDFGAGKLSNTRTLRKAGINVSAFEPYFVTMGDKIHKEKSLEIARRFLDEAEAGTPYSSVFISSVFNSVPFMTDRKQIAVIAAALCYRDGMVVCWCQSDKAPQFVNTKKKFLTAEKTLTFDLDYVFVAGENGPELIVGKQGSTVFPTEETDKIIDALNGMEPASDTSNEKKFDQFLQALTGVTVDAPEPGPGESLFDSVLGKVADIVSGKNSDLEAINAAYTGLPEVSTVALPASNAPVAAEAAPLNVQPNAQTAAQESTDATKEITKRIILEIVGNGSVTVSGGSGDGMSEKAVLELLTNNIKPVLMGVIKDEIFEEGQLSYDY